MRSGNQTPSAEERQSPSRRDSKSPSSETPSKISGTVFAYVLLVATCKQLTSAYTYEGVLIPLEEPIYVPCTGSICLTDFWHSS